MDIRDFRNIYRDKLLYEAANPQSNVNAQQIQAYNNIIDYMDKNRTVYLKGRYNVDGKINVRQIVTDLKDSIVIDSEKKFSVDSLLDVVQDRISAYLAIDAYTKDERLYNHYFSNIALADNKNFVDSEILKLQKEDPNSEAKKILDYIISKGYDKRYAENKNFLLVGSSNNQYEQALDGDKIIDDVIKMNGNNPSKYSEQTLAVLKPILCSHINKIRLLSYANKFFEKEFDPMFFMIDAYAQHPIYLSLSTSDKANFELDLNKKLAEHKKPKDMIEHMIKDGVSLKDYIEWLFDPTYKRCDFYGYELTDRRKASADFLEVQSKMSNAANSADTVLASFKSEYLSARDSSKDEEPLTEDGDLHDLLPPFLKESYVVIMNAKKVTPLDKKKDPNLKAFADLVDDDFTGLSGFMEYQSFIGDGIAKGLEMREVVEVIVEVELNVLQTRRDMCEKAKAQADKWNSLIEDINNLYADFGKLKKTKEFKAAAKGKTRLAATLRHAGGLVTGIGMAMAALGGFIGYIIPGGSLISNYLAKPGSWISRGGRLMVRAGQPLSARSDKQLSKDKRKANDKLGRRSSLFED